MSEVSFGRLFGCLFGHLLSVSEASQRGPIPKVKTRPTKYKIGESILERNRNLSSLDVFLWRYSVERKKRKRGKGKKTIERKKGEKKENAFARSCARKRRRKTEVTKRKESKGRKSKAEYRRRSRN